MPKFISVSVAAYKYRESSLQSFAETAIRYAAVSEEGDVWTLDTAWPKPRKWKKVATDADAG